MKHIEAVRAALRGTAPVVAIPVEGRVPVCIKARLLKGALKGVTIHSVEICGGWLKVEGMAGNVRTCSKFAPMGRYEALRQIREWSIKEREKRIRVINQGVLSAQTRRELLKAKIEAEPVAELKAAQKHLERIYNEAKEHVNPTPDHYSESYRQKCSEYRANRHLRKRGSVIQWRLKQLRETLSKITCTKGGRRGPKKTFATKREYIPRMILLNREIATLEKQFKALYPPVWQEREGWAEGGYWESNGIKLRHWRTDDEDEYDQKKLAERLREARGTIRALTPPEDENVLEHIAA